MEQLSKDTDALKAAEQHRSEKLDTALVDLETVIADLKSSNRRREDEAQRIRDDVSNLKSSIPKALDAQKNLTDNRLQEINAELKSLKTIISQRVASQQSSSVNSYGSRPAVVPAPASVSAPENGASTAASAQPAPEEVAKPTNGAAPLDSPVSNGRSSPFNSGMSAANVKIPEWQRAMASKKNNASANKGSDSKSNVLAEAGSGSS